MTRDASPAQPKPEAPAGIGGWIANILAHGLFALFGAMGLFVLYVGLRLLITGEREFGTGPRIVVTGDPWGTALLSVALGLIFAAIGLGFFYFVYLRDPLRRARRWALETRYRGQPWMLRRDWAARRVVDSDSSIFAMIFMWAWSAVWWGGLLLIGIGNRDQVLAAVTAHWGAAVLALIFCLPAVVGLLLAVGFTVVWRRGRSVLCIETLPGRLGDRFRGTLEARFSKRPAALEAEIACERMTWVTQHEDGETSDELESEIMWSETHALDTSRLVLGEGGGSAKVPLDLPLPADQPPSALDAKGEGIVWRLTVWEVRDGAGRDGDDAGRAGGDGRDVGTLFSASFEVPVFGG
jgi:hypothetical protein